MWFDISPPAHTGPTANRATVRDEPGGARDARLVRPVLSAAVDLEFPEGVAVLGGAGGAVHADVPAGAGDAEVLGSTAAGGGGVDRRPRRVIGGGLDLEGLAVGGLPLQGDLADGLGGAEVDFQPL